MSTAHTMKPANASVPDAERSRRFVFERDSFAFANELVWEYRFDQAGRMTTVAREPKPDYTLRCFVLTAAARQFSFHAHFDAAQPRMAEAQYRVLVRQVLSRNPRETSSEEQRIRIPGFAGLRSFSDAFEPLLKAECGGAWRSYVLRSHWRMVFPISRRHQAWTAEQLKKTLSRKATAVVHLVTFPKLTINHGVVLYGFREEAAKIEFDAYDPNGPSKPAQLVYDATTRAFHFPANAYWAGGKLDVIEIYRNWFI